MKTIIVAVVLFIFPTISISGPIADLDHRINQDVSRRTKDDKFYDDKVHFALGIFEAAATDYVTRKIDWFDDHPYWRQFSIIAVPMLLRAGEEATNKHPDWEHDLWGNMAGSATYMLTVNFLLPVNWEKKLQFWK